MCGASSLGVTEAPIRGRDPRGFWLFPCSLTKYCSCPNSGSNTKYLEERETGKWESNEPEREILEAPVMSSSFCFMLSLSCLPEKLEPFYFISCIHKLSRMWEGEGKMRRRARNVCEMTPKGDAVKKKRTPLNFLPLIPTTPAGYCSVHTRFIKNKLPCVHIKVCFNQHEAGNPRSTLLKVAISVVIFGRTRSFRRGN